MRGKGLVTGLFSLFAVVASAATFEVNPAQLDFGSVGQGSLKTLTLTVKNNAAATSQFQTVVTSPFVANVSSFFVDGGDVQTIPVTLPPSAPLGRHSGRINIQCLTPSETISVTLTAVVNKIDLSVTITGFIRQTKLANGTRDVRIGFTLTSTAPQTQAATKIFTRIDQDPENEQYFAQDDVYTGAGTRKELQVIVPGKTKQITLRAIADVNGQFDETNEHNTATATIPLPTILF